MSDVSGVADFRLIGGFEEVQSQAVIERKRLGYFEHVKIGLFFGASFELDKKFLVDDDN
jgi:hypothetical protein